MLMFSPSAILTMCVSLSTAREIISKWNSIMKFERIRALLQIKYDGKSTLIRNTI